MSLPRRLRSQTRVVLLVGTQKGLFVLHSDIARGDWTLDGPYIAGYEILHAWLDPRAPSAGYAAASHAVWGAHIYRTADAGRSWETLVDAPAHPQGEREDSVKAIWYLAPGHRSTPQELYAGIDPPGLFVSGDRGLSWSRLAGLNRHPTSSVWEPARGGFSVHSIQVDPSCAARLYAAVSAGGAYRSEDRGETWRAINRGVRAENRPQRFPEAGHNIHRLLMHTARPERLYRQCYNGVYRSDDRGEHWAEITAGLPSDFGYGIASPASDPDTAYVIPEESSHMRATVGGRLRVYRTRDAGGSWQPLVEGLPQSHAYVTVLRDALTTDTLEPCGVYFGTSSGHVFASRDGGDAWTPIASFLPRVLSVSAAIVPAE